MDIKPVKQKLNDLIRKYKYAALILALGLVLMMLPTNWERKENESKQEINNTQQESSVCQQLSKILASIDGVGRVEVMLTVATGPQTVYQTDDNRTTSANDSSTRQETVIITDSNRNEMGLITQVIPEKYQGAIVVCQGAGSPSVQLAVIQAVSNVTGLPSDRICVLKMK